MNWLFFVLGGGMTALSILCIIDGLLYEAFWTFWLSVFLLMLGAITTKPASKDANECHSKEVEKYVVITYELGNSPQSRIGIDVRELCQALGVEYDPAKSNEFYLHLVRIRSNILWRK